MKGFDISIPVTFDKKQLIAFGGPPATRKAYRAGAFVGDTRLGGSCNCDVYTFSPHLNGTHTEGVGHISKERIPVPGVGLVGAQLITVKPKNGLITRAMLFDAVPTEALIIRTLPNLPAKKTKKYAAWPTFAPAAMEHIAALGVQHLLVDLPSVDLIDDAKLTNHRIFWRKNARQKTITELIYVPAAVKDGDYILNLQVANFDGDAAPSRPVLYKVKL